MTAFDALVGLAGLGLGWLVVSLFLGGGRRRPETGEAGGDTSGASSAHAPADRPDAPGTDR